ncbi:outer membrane protein [Orientia tsutsugamushi]|uniref:Outer membrane beta-barrel domain protein n=1 Tax=Orientia tsutsugamushi str. TA716 TaxID=1359175 RepID=A0A0F3PCA3_ORITS|nr:outer membrane beta-barrel protein [Orientia tsutsugamushi]KJV77541.1 outer membrane beta-barrel domain protein [Orientia tsutsugamushi str. TA716]
MNKIKKVIISAITALSALSSSSLVYANNSLEYLEHLEHLEYNYYAKVSAIGLMPNNWESHFKNKELEFNKFSFGIGGSLGAYVNRYFRTEVGAMWLFDITTKPEQSVSNSQKEQQASGNDLDNNNPNQLSLNSGALALRCYLDFSKLGPVSIFVGGGAGASYTGGAIEQHKIDYKVGFYKEAMAGISAEVIDEVHLDLEYKYMWIGSITGEDVKDKPYDNFKQYDLNGHSLSLSIRFSF